MPAGDAQTGRLSGMARGWLLWGVLTRGALSEHWQVQLVPGWASPCAGAWEDMLLADIGTVLFKGQNLPTHLLLAFLPFLDNLLQGAPASRAPLPLVTSLFPSLSPSPSFLPPFLSLPTPDFLLIL